MGVTGGRRERLRAETTAEIKQVALALMAAGGPDAITLRAIAREMGMTANAIYGYFATRDDLVSTLIHDVNTELADTIETAMRGAANGDDPGGPVRAWAGAFRGWALANPQGFRLVYGDPVPGYRAPEGGAAPDAALRLCLALMAVAAAAWPYAAPLDEGDFDWSDFDAGLREKIRPAFPELPPAGVALGLRIWGHLHGLVVLEIYGHLRAQTSSPNKLFQSELAGLLRSLGLPPAGPAERLI
ncbi:AcrR family transcriptional regulator [Frankia sp. AiPs1]|uniref:TetR/AcrR family transcriptional regulator n=1 Tax=Frankia sp. AiPa1 TaxID=573492 RepID=UPI00202B0CBE|nr:WHG domain-containing protein [Frankia sp. AiPa1]MCL9761382.1 TetR/AcrR family transcriptional regulator [Frankia sp. AiPa1]